MTKPSFQSWERFPARFRPLAVLFQLPADAPGRGWDGRGHGDQIWAKHMANSGYLFCFFPVKRQDSSACSFRPPGWFLHMKKCNKRRKEDRRMKTANTRHAKPLLGIKECKQVPYNVFGKLLLLSEETVASTRGKKGDLKTFCRELCTVSLQQTPPYQLKSGAVLPQTLQPSNLNPVKSQLNYQPNIPPIRGGLSSCLC